MQTVVRSVLDRFLGPYCDFEGNINVDMWSGKAVLRHVKVKPDLFNSMDIPVDVKAGFIDRIGFVCDWRSGFNKPVELELSHVYVIVTPRTDFTKIDVTQLRQEHLAHKLMQKAQQIKDWEDSQFDSQSGYVGPAGKRLFRAQVESAGTPERPELQPKMEDLSKMEKIISKIVANLKIKVKHLHVRMETGDCAVGIMLENFSLETTDEKFCPTFIKEVGDKIFKCLSLQNIAVYVSSGKVSSFMNKESLEPDEAPSSEPQFRYVLRTEADDSGFKYVLHPVSLSVRLIMQQYPSETNPKIRIDAGLENIRAELDQQQYAAILSIQDALSTSTNTLNSLIGPDNIEETKSEPNYREIDREYAELYQRTLFAAGHNFPDLTTEQRSRLMTLERQHTTEEIKLYRKAVLIELDHLLASRWPELNYEIFRKSDRRASKSMFSWLYAEDPTVLNDLVPVDVPFGDALDVLVSEEKAMSGHILFEANFVIPEISLTFTLDKAPLFHGSIIGCTMSGTAFDLSIIDIHLALENMIISNISDPKMAFPEILFRSQSGDMSAAVAHFEVRVNPPDLPAKFAIFGGFEPIDAVFDYLFVQRVISFFRIPVKKEIASVAMKPHEIASPGLLASISKDTPRELIFARRPTVILDLTIAAPTILIPEDPTSEDSSVLVVDLGCFSLSAKPADKTDSVVDVSKLDPDDVQDVEHPTNNMCYDVFKLKYENLQIFFAQGGPRWRSISQGAVVNILQPISASLFLGLCVLVDSGPFASVVISMDVKPLVFQISQSDVCHFLTIASSFKNLPQISNVPDSQMSPNASVPTPQPGNAGVAVIATEHLPALQIRAKETNVDLLLKFSLSSISVAAVSGSTILFSSGVDGIVTKVTRRSYDTEVVLTVQEMHVEECLSDVVLLRSRPASRTSQLSIEPSKDFINISFKQFDRESPSWTELDRHLNVSVGLIDINIEPVSIFDTAMFLQSTVHSSRDLTAKKVDRPQPTVFQEAPSTVTENGSSSATSFVAVAWIFDGFSVQVWAGKKTLLAATLEELSGTLLRSDDGDIESQISLSSFHVKDCLVPTGDKFNEIIISGGSTSKLVDIKCALKHNEVSGSCQIDSVRCVVRTALIADILDLIQFSPLNKVPGMFADLSTSPNRAKSSPQSSQIKAGEFNIDVNQFEISLAPEGKITDTILSLLISHFSIHSKALKMSSRLENLSLTLRNLSAYEKETTVCVLVLVKLIEASSSGGNESLLSQAMSQQIFLSSSSFEISTDSPQYSELLLFYNNVASNFKSACHYYATDEPQFQFPQLDYNLSDVLPSLCLRLSRLEGTFSFMQQAFAMDAVFEGSVQASLQSPLQPSVSIVMGADMLFSACKEVDASWNVAANVASAYVAQICGDSSVNILRPVNCVLKAAYSTKSVSTGAFILSVILGSFHITISYSSILLVQDIVSKLQTSFHPVFPTVNTNQSQIKPQSDRIAVPVQIELIRGVGSNERMNNLKLQHWNVHEIFFIDLQSVRVDIVNDIFGAASSRRVPVMEVLLLVDPRSVGHGYGISRHFYSGIRLAARVYNTTVASWEPLIEPTRLSIVARQTMRSKFIGITTLDRLDVNISEIMLSSILNSLRPLASMSASRITAAPSTDTDNNSNRTDLTFYTEVQNSVEVDVEFIVSEAGTSKSISVAPQQTEFLPVVDALFLSIVVGKEWLPIDNVRIDRAGFQSFWLVKDSKSSQSAISARVIVEVYEKGLSKVVHLRSDAHIENCSTVTFIVGSTELSPMESIWLPCLSRQRISMLPVRIKGMQSEAICNLSFDRTVLQFHDENSLHSTYIIASKETEPCNTYKISLMPPLVVQNLLPVNSRFRIRQSAEFMDESENSIAPSNEHSVLSSDPMQPFEFSLLLPFMSSWSSPITLCGPIASSQIFVADSSGGTLTLDVELHGDRLTVLVQYWVYDLVQLPNGENLQISSDKFTKVPQYFPAPETDAEPDRSTQLNEPLMFSSNTGHAFLRLSDQNSSWSNPILISAAGASDVTAIHVGAALYQFNVNVSLCPAPFTRTKAITFSPRYILVNSLQFPILIKQAGTESESRVLSSSRHIIYYWDDSAQPEHLCIKHDHPAAEWSAPFSLSNVIDDTIPVNYGASGSRLVRLEVQMASGSSNFILLSHQKPSLAPVTIENRTVTAQVRFQQKGEDHWISLPPANAKPFALRDGTVQRTILLQFIPIDRRCWKQCHTLEVDLSMAQDFHESMVSTEPFLHELKISSKSIGPMKQLCITESVGSPQTLIYFHKFLQESLDESLVQWTRAKVECCGIGSIGSLSDSSFIYLNLVEISGLKPQHERGSVFATVTFSGETSRSDGFQDLLNPFWNFKSYFRIKSNEPYPMLCVSFYEGDPSQLIRRIEFPLDISALKESDRIDKWVPAGDIIGQAHLQIRYFGSKSDLLNEKVKDLSKIIDVNRQVLRSIESVELWKNEGQEAVASSSIQQTVSKSEAQQIQVVDIQVSVVGFRGQLASTKVSNGVCKFESKFNFETFGSSLENQQSNDVVSTCPRLLCDFKVNAQGPYDGTSSMALLRDQNGCIVAGVTNEIFAFSITGNTSQGLNGSLTLTLREENIDEKGSISYTDLGSCIAPFSKSFDRAWVGFSQGNNEVCLSMSVSSPTTFDVEALEQPVSQISVAVPHIGVSLIDKRPREVVYLCLRNISVSLNSSETATGFLSSVDLFQGDNQTQESIFPVFFCKKRHHGSQRKIPPWFQFALFVWTNRKNEGFLNIEFADFLLQHSEIFLEEELVWIVYELAIRLMGSFKAFDETEQHVVGIDVEKPRSFPEPGSAQNVFIRRLTLQPIALNVTIQPDLARREDARSRVVSRRPNPVDMLLGAAGVTFTSVQTAPIRMDSLELFDIYGSWSSLIAPIRRHYILQGLRQVYKILGSLSVIGNPIGLVSNLGKGFKHLFYDPAEGIVSSPLDFGKGLASGSQRFVQHTLGGILSSAGQITSTLGTGVAVLSMDRSFLEKRELDERERIRGAAQGTETHHVGTGLAALGSGIMGGLKGMVTKPAEGLRSGGAFGFFKGIVKGGASLITRPVVGAIDLGTHTVQGFQGLLGGPNIFLGSERIRLPRYIPRSGILTPFDLEAAKGQAVIWSSSNLLSQLPVPLTKDQAHQESYIDSREISHLTNKSHRKSLLVVLTNFRVIAAKTNAISEPQSDISQIHFSAGLNQIKSVSVDGTIVILQRLDSHYHVIKTDSSAEANGVVEWIMSHIRNCTPIIRNATFGAGTTWLNITDVLQEKISKMANSVTLSQEDIMTLGKTTAIKSGDTEIDWVYGVLRVDYTKGPDVISAEFDLMQPITL